MKIGGIQFDEGEFAGFTGDEQQIADAEKLAVAVIVASPDTLAGRQIDTLQDSIGEAIDETVFNDHVVELRLQDAMIVPEAFDGPGGLDSGVSSDVIVG